MANEVITPFVHVDRRSETFRAEELRAVLRLEGELSELPADSNEQKQHALEGMCALVGAQVGIWARFGDLEQTNGMILEALHCGWSGERERRLYDEFMHGGQKVLPDPSIPRVARVFRPPFGTFLRQQLLDDDEWYRSNHVQHYRRAGGVDSFLYSVRMQPPGGYVIALHRPWGARPFNEHERQLLDLFHRESRALVPAPTNLPHHLDRTLRVLLRGLSEKQVAAEIGLSPHTVHDYVRAIYRHYRVGSRAELFAHLAAARSIRGPARALRGHAQSA